MDNPYTLLGLPPGASPDEIRAAYRRLAAERHPDVHPPEKKQWASEQMVQLNAARDLLLDPARRAAYDAARARTPHWAPADYGYPQPPRARRPRWYQRVPPGRMFIAFTLAIVALPYLWLLTTLSTGTTTEAVTGLESSLQCLFALFLAVGVAATLLSVMRQFRR
jgi:hypothetical protein